MMKIVCNILVIVCIGVGAMADQAVVLETFDISRETYDVTLGTEYPGANANLARIPAESGNEGSLAVAYDFTQGGRYVGWVYSDFLPPQPRELRFRTRTDRPRIILIRMTDSTQQTHQIRHNVEGGNDWQQVTIPLPAHSPQDAYWGGKNDGKVHQPLLNIVIGVENSDPPKGTLFLDDVQITSAASAEEIQLALRKQYGEKPILSFVTKAPGNLFYPSDSIEAKLTARQPALPIQCTVTGSVLDADSKQVAGIGPLVLDTKNGYTAKLNSLPKSPGFYRVLLEVQAGDISQEMETRYAVIPANPHLEEKEPESPFGVNTHFNQYWPAEIGAIVKRTGIAWVRDCEAGLEDKAIPVIRANHLCYMPCFTHLRDALPARFKADLEKDPKHNRKWDYSQEIEFHRVYAEKYGLDVDVYDLMNEPHNPWAAALGGGWWGGAWVKTFADYGKQVTAALKQADPGCKVVWEDMDQLIWYKQWVPLGVARKIDIISPHTYNLHRNRPDPEDQFILPQMEGFRRYCRARNLPWNVWAGEVGFSSFALNDVTPTQYYTPCSELGQARWLVRMMVVQLAVGVEKIFWYDFMNDGSHPNDPEQNFGLIRMDHLPKPAVVAYANLISKTRNYRWLRRYTIGGGADAFVFAVKNSDAPLLIAWLRNGTKQERLPVRSKVASVTVTDLLGRSRTVPVNDHTLVLELSESPVYVEGLEVRDVRPFLVESTDAIPK